MAIVTKNILVGAGDLLLAPGNEPLLPPVGTPGTRVRDDWRRAGAKSPVTPLAGAGSWRHVGATQDGLEISYEPDYGEVEVDQLKDAALIFNQGLRIMINTNLAEATLFNLALAWGYHSRYLAETGYSGSAEATTDKTTGLVTTNDEVLRLANPDDETVERQVLVVGNAPKSDKALAQDKSRYNERVYLGRRAVEMDTSAHSLRKNEATVFPVSFRLLPDPTYSGTEYGIIIDRLITA